ncbi:MAG TPA: hypothetical protein VF264_05525 [Rhodanobacteraceae bacterium]
MRKFLFIAAIALLGTLGLSACQKSNQGETTTAAKVTRPTSSTDIKGWQAYLTQIVEANMGNITNQPYVYFVPGAADPASNATVGRVQGQLNDVVAATVLPGNMVAAGGPSSANTALLMENAFKTAAKGSFKGVVVLFIGDKADEAAVQAAVAPSGATFKFAQM